MPLDEERECLDISAGDFGHQSSVVANSAHDGLAATGHDLIACHRFRLNVAVERQMYLPSCNVPLAGCDALTASTEVNHRFTDAQGRQAEIICGGCEGYLPGSR